MFLKASHARVAAAVCVLGITGIAHAQTMHGTIRGTVTEVNTALTDFFSVGEGWTLNYSFDASTPDTRPDLDFLGIYSISAIMIEMDSGYTASWVEGRQLTRAQSDFHQFQVVTSAPALFDSGVPGWSVDIANVFLNDATATAWIDDSIATSVDVDAFDSSLLQLGFRQSARGGGVPQAFVIGEIDSVSIVPAPGALALAGLAGFAGVRRRRA